MPDLHVHKLGPDWLVAESPGDALACAAEYYHAMGVDPDNSQPVLECTDNLLLRIRCDRGPQTRSCAEWAKSNGRGLLFKGVCFLTGSAFQRWNGIRA